jgi:hypothetical protein
MSSKSVSPPIPPAPINALFIGIFIGMTLISLVVDQSGDASLQRAFYNARGREGAPTWFNVYNLLMLAMGLYSNVTNGIFAFTRSSPRGRKLADLVQLVLFVAIVSWSVLRVLPAEKTLDALLHTHLVVLGLQVLQLITAFWAFKAQSSTATTKPKNA